ncbi:cytochrome C biosynthesis protein [bacterium]|nr:cytochrome C biosynthesis protein [bacterium]
MFDQLFLTVNEWMTGGSILAALGCFLWGMISVVFSPCHLASIPLIISYVAGQKRVLKPTEASRYAVMFTLGLFVTIAVIGIICSLLGRMLGEIGPYWTIVVGAILVWVSLDMIGIPGLSMAGTALNRFHVQGLGGAFILGLAYGVLSGSCTFGFIAPILAFITIQEKIMTGIILIVLFGIGHCVPIAIAGSSAALVKKVMENSRFQNSGMWFRRLAGGAICCLGLYFIVRPFVIQ